MNTLIRRIILLFLFYFTYLFTCKAQNPLFKNYGVKEGLPSSETYEVFQDSKGYIWIATDGGISRFDGYEFKNFTTEDGLPHNVNFGFYEDHKGRIWLKSYADKLCYFLNDKFHVLDFKTALSKEFNYRICNSLYVDDEDTLWVGFEMGFKYMKIGINDSIDRVSPELISLDEGIIFLKEIKKNGFIYGSTGLSGSLEKEFKISNVYINKNGTKTILNKLEIGHEGILTPITRMVKTKKNTFFIARSNFLHEFNPYSSINIKYFPYTIFSMNEDKAGNLWVGTKNKGVFYFPDKNLQKPVQFLKELSITAVIEDNEGGYWFSTLENGIFYIPNINFHNYTQSEGLTINKINCLSISSDNKLWLGLNNGKVNSLENKRITKEFDCNLLPNSINNISSIQCLKNGWIAIGGEHLTILKNNSPPITVSDSLSNFFMCKKILPIENGLVVSSLTDFFEITFLKKGYKINKIKVLNRIHSILKTKTGITWIGKPNGLLMYYQNKIVNYLDKKIDFRIDDLKEDKNNYIWAASKGKGIAVIKEDVLFFINKTKGLASDYCSNLFIDSDNIIWAGTNNGISKIKIKSYQPFSYEIENYSVAQGLISNEINQILVKGDSVYLATKDGLSVFNKKHIITSKTEVPLYITQFSVNDSAYSLKKNYELNYDQNFIKVNFIALSYKNQGNIEYKYRLIGIDTSWHSTKSTFVDFTTLPYGNYSFEVLAKNNDGYWNTKLAIISFVINPPYWHTWWFRVLAGLIVSLLLFILVRYRIRLIIKRANEKTILYQKAAETEKEKMELYQKATDMEIRFLGSQMNPHFTFNAMNSIQKFILNKDPLVAQAYLAKYSRLIRRVLENNMKSFVELEEEIEMLELYLEIESVRFDKKFNFKILRSGDIEDNEFKIPPMIIQPYVENAIWHGLSNKENGVGEITLSFALENNCIKCIIEDNGIGRDKAATFKACKEHTSVGMLITTQRLQKLHSNEYLGIQNEIIDLKDNEGNAVGTRVIVYLPINNN